MEIAAFDVRSSSSEGLTYRVALFETDSGHSLSCSCKAGEHGSHCKHRLALWRGGHGIQLAAEQGAPFAECAERLAETDLYSEVSPMIVEADEMEVEIRRLKGRRSGLMKKISIALRA